MKAWTQVVFDDRPYSGLLPQESENRSQSQTIWCDWICAARTSKERNIRTLFPLHEPRRSGGSAERRHSNTSQYAALYRDAATVHGPDARPQLDVEAHQEPALAVGRDAFHRVPISPVRSLRRGGTRPYQVVGDGG
jgi:hypothetical protein